MTRYDFMFVFDAKNANPNGDPRCREHAEN